MQSQIETHEHRPEPQRLDAQLPSGAPRAQRIAALDFTKGALVLIMVLYHWINYFIGSQWGYYQYLRFLTPSFIFITGFMISNVYLSKYNAADPHLPKRLVTRGLKLLAIFVALNAARILILPVSSTGVAAGNLLEPKNIFIVFVSGNLADAGSKLVSFSILMPISYLLILAGMLMFPYRSHKRTFHIASAFLLTLILILSLLGIRSLNLEFFTIGMLGVLAGFTTIAAINGFVRHPFMLGFAYLCYIFAVTVWNVPFPLLVVGVCLSLMAIYLVGISSGDSGIVQAEVILLGKYSLFGYISQVTVLQVLAASLRQVKSGVGVLILSFGAAFVLTILSVEIVDRARARMAVVDWLYKVIFA